MEHNEVKKTLLKNPEAKKEYNNLDIMYEIKKQVIKYRIDNNLSQKELAEKIGTKQSAISRLENDDYNPSFKFMNKVANALGKKLEIRFH